MYNHSEADFQMHFLDWKVWKLNTIWLKFISKGPIDNYTDLVQIMAWSRICDKPLFELMMAWGEYAYIRHSASIS